jgi:hypothetical protein
LPLRENLRRNKYTVYDHWRLANKCITKLGKRSKLWAAQQQCPSAIICAIRYSLYDKI